MTIIKQIVFSIVFAVTAVLVVDRREGLPVGRVVDEHRAERAAGLVDRQPRREHRLPGDPHVLRQRRGEEGDAVLVIHAGAGANA